VAAEAPAATVEEHIRARLAAAVGGWRGSLEAAVPTAAFVVMWVWRHDLRLALGIAGAIAVVVAAVRIARHESLQFVLSGVVGIAIAAFFALRSGRAQDAFLPGILWSAGVGVISLLSILARWPVIGFMIGAAEPTAAEDPFGWRRHADIVKVCSRLTWVLVGLAVVRAAVMVPLYAAGNVTALGVAKLVLGWPAYAAAVALMGALLLRGRTPYVPEPVSPRGRVGSADPG
jgi:hypothetical protein